MQVLAEVALLILNLAWWVVIISVIMSWLIAFNVLDTRNRVVYQIADMLYRLTEPVYQPIRNMLPAMGGIDLSPLIVLIAIFALQRAIIIYML
ncbi:YggT family protein [Pyruvatibacter mobilis]|jgi:YggT family protein|uniref:YggT family protein n=1 Tax=Pyruvatibacter mobilis TaxID=1712261 RepID=A0A845Q763_9HYPH|nr:YggT family protein [Pyruvatibacter mobilis]NBG94164.1 YggT family protein [Pyruvatibacter mobilis]QJD76474.1 YggT family protein [Pyruvatibacter mobilis]GGD00853.1 YggT family protein [Pyruvatibacter mobilis]